MWFFFVLWTFCYRTMILCQKLWKFISWHCFHLLSFETTSTRFWVEVSYTSDPELDPATTRDPEQPVSKGSDLVTFRGEFLRNFPCLSEPAVQIRRGWYSHWYIRNPQQKNPKKFKIFFTKKTVSDSKLYSNSNNWKQKCFFFNFVHAQPKVC